MQTPCWRSLILLSSSSHPSLILLTLIPSPQIETEEHEHQQYARITRKVALRSNENVHETLARVKPAWFFALFVLFPVRVTTIRHNKSSHARMIFAHFKLTRFIVAYASFPKCVLVAFF